MACSGLSRNIQSVGGNARSRLKTSVKPSTTRTGHDMTLAFHKGVLLVLLITGIAAGAGLYFNSGPLLVFGTYFGWFGAAISIAAYIVLLVLLLIRGSFPVWGRYSSINMGLALVGISVLGFEAQMSMVLLVTAFLSVAIAVMVARLRLFERRESVLLILAIVVMTALSPLKQVWPQVLLAAGLILFVGSTPLSLRQLGSR